MGNDQSCEIEWIGSIKIHMFDEVICILTNIRFIPNMRKNLILLGILDTKRLTWSVSGGLLQVKNDDMTILRGHKHQNKHKNLYVLEGTTIVGEVHATMF
jgi:hypothetical protein